MYHSYVTVAIERTVKYSVVYAILSYFRPYTRIRDEIFREKPLGEVGGAGRGKDISLSTPTLDPLDQGFNRRSLTTIPSGRLTDAWGGPRQWIRHQKVMEA